MKYIPLIIGLTGLLVASPAGAGYHDMKKEFESYSPPAYLMRQHQPVSHSVADKPVAVDPFSAEQHRIEALENEWKNDSTNRNKNTFFYPLADNFPADLKRVAQDSTATAERLSKRISLETLEGLTSLRNPDIKSAEDQLKATISTFSQVSNLDEILRTYSVFYGIAFTGYRPHERQRQGYRQTQFSLSRCAFPQRASRQSSHAGGLGNRCKQRDGMPSQMPGKHIGIYYLIERHSRLPVRPCHCSTIWSRLPTSRYEAGNTSYQDVIKVRIQKEKLIEELVTFREMEKNLEQKVFELVDIGPANRLGTLIPPAPAACAARAFPPICACP